MRVTWSRVPEVRLAQSTEHGQYVTKEYIWIIKREVPFGKRCYIYIFNIIIIILTSSPHPWSSTMVGEPAPLPTRWSCIVFSVIGHVYSAPLLYVQYKTAATTVANEWTEKRVNILYCVRYRHIVYSMCINSMNSYCGHLQWLQKYLPLNIM